MSYTIVIPVYPHVKKIIETYYPLQPVKVSMVSPIGTIFYSLLSSNQNLQQQKYNEFYKETISFELPETYAQYRGVWLTNYSIHIFNSQIDGMFRDKLFGALRLLNEMGVKRQNRKVMHFFFRQHNITEDDLSYSTIQQDYYRFMNDKEHRFRSKLFQCQLSPNTSPEYNQLIKTNKNNYGN